MNVFAAKDFQQATTQGHAPQQQQQQQQQLTLAASTKKSEEREEKEGTKPSTRPLSSAQLNSTKSLICENATVWEKSLSSNNPKPNRAELNRTELDFSSCFVVH